MPDFSRIIAMAYLRILERPPDAGGLAVYNDAMNVGLSEAQMRESLLRSAEYAQKHPDVPVAPRRRGAAGGAPAAKRRQATRRR